MTLPECYAGGTGQAKFKRALKRDALVARMDYYLLLGYRIQIGKLGVAHVWFWCYEKGYFEKGPKHYFGH